MSWCHEPRVVYLCVMRAHVLVCCCVAGMRCPQSVMQQLVDECRGVSEDGGLLGGLSGTSPGCWLDTAFGADLDTWQGSSSSSTAGRSSWAGRRC